MYMMENLALLLDCRGFCVSQGVELLSLNMLYSWASRLPSHHMVTSIPQVFIEPGSAQMVDLGRISAKKSKAGSQDIPAPLQLSRKECSGTPSISHT
jgi:hypothetical protein